MARALTLTEVFVSGDLHITASHEARVREYVVTADDGNPIAPANVVNSDWPTSNYTITPAFPEIGWQWSIGEQSGDIGAVSGSLIFCEDVRVTQLTPSALRAVCLFSTHQPMWLWKRTLEMSTTNEKIIYDLDWFGDNGNAPQNYFGCVNWNGLPVQMQGKGSEKIGSAGANSNDVPGADTLAPKFVLTFSGLLWASETGFWEYVQGSVGTTNSVDTLTAFPGLDMWLFLGCTGEEERKIFDGESAVWRAAFKFAFDPLAHRHTLFVTTDGNQGKEQVYKADGVTPWCRSYRVYRRTDWTGWAVAAGLTGIVPP